MVESSNVSTHALTKFAIALLQAAGMNPSSAEQVAEALVWADSRGTDSHGVSRIPMYLSLLESGQMHGAATVQRRLSLPALTVLDANRCPGAVAMSAAAYEAMSSAREQGLGMCLVSETTHTGALGYFTERIAHGGMIGIAGAASGPHMAYFGAALAGVSTSPLSIAAPGADPIVFDMASGAVALGKLMRAKALGEPIPSGWAIDDQGRPTTDPADAKVPLPLGGPKGSGLALMMEMLTSLLVGNPILAPSLELPAARRRHYQNAFVIAIDVEAVIDKDGYIDEAAALSNAIKTLRPQEGQEVLLPGERGHRQREESLRSGVRLAPHVAAELGRLARKFSVSTPW